MARSEREYLRDWLRDAHALEEQAEQLFSGQASRLKIRQELQSKMDNELSRIKQSQDMLQQCIRRLGGQKSLVKDAFGKVAAGAHNVTGVALQDEPVKGILAVHNFTHMAIGAYKVLIAAAEAVGDLETLRVCGTILADTQARALWIETEMREVTRCFLATKASSRPAKASSRPERPKITPASPELHFKCVDSNGRKRPSL